MLESMDLKHRIRWGVKLSVEDRAALARLADDGHQLIRDRRGTTIKVTAQSVRNTILHHTLLHEVGHWGDWQERVLRVKSAPHDPERQQLKNTYFARAHKEREQFAIRYAERHAARLREAGVIPFDTLG